MAEKTNKNMELYNKFRTVPKEAQKQILAGRLKGMTDINPMFRIQVLTEQFGPCGIGWKSELVSTWIDTVGNEIVANVIINLYVKNGEEWSDPIVGIGGSKLATMEKSGQYVSDEAYKMAYTDAISVACKALGVGADIYWAGGRTKYSDAQDPVKQAPKAPTRELTWREKVIALADELRVDMNQLAAEYELSRDTTDEKFEQVYKALESQKEGRK